MSIESYTTADEVRSALGVAPEELPDTIIEQPLYERLLQFELRDIAVGMEAAYLAFTEEPTDPDEAYFYSVMRAFAPYAVANVMLNSIELFAPVKVNDSKTALTRKDDPFEATRVNVQRMYQALKTRLIDAYNALNPTTPAVAPTFFISPGLAVGLGSDPVTGS